MNNEVLQDYCKDINSVAEYLLVVGVSDQQIKEHLLEGERLQPEVLCQFPPFDRPQLKLPESIAQFCAPVGIEFRDSYQTSVYSVVLTSETGDRVYCTCLKFYEAYVGENPGYSFAKDSESSSLAEESLPFLSEDMSLSRKPKDSSSFKAKLIPKILVIVSKKAFFRTYGKILKGFYRLSKETLAFPIELYLIHFLLQVPAPSKGHIKIEYKLHKETHLFSIPPCNKLPLLDLNAATLFACLDLDSVLTVFKYLSLERSVVFISNSETKLLRCSYSLLSFLYPFNWSLIYVPILPVNLLDYMFSPVNFIFGVHSDYMNEVFSSCEESTLVVDLDSNQLFGGKPTSMPSLPGHYGNKLRNRLKNLLKRCGASNLKLLSSKIEERNLVKMREYFFQFYVSILKDYKKFTNFNDEENSPFDKTRFLINVPDNSRAYMKELLNTQMFANFCEERVRPQSIEQHCGNLFFDESITAKQNRNALKFHKGLTPFINDTSQEHHSTHSVRTLETEFASSVQYKYSNFPLLTTYSLAGFPMFRDKPTNYEVVDRGKPQRLSATSDFNCILICWFELWASCLWYQDSSELDQRITEVCKILEQFKTVPGKTRTAIYNLVLTAVSWVEPSLALPIYSLMSESQVIIDASTIQVIQRIVSSLRKRHEGLVIRNTGQWLELYSEPFRASTYEAQGRERVFTKSSCVSIKSKQDACFLFKDNCQTCKKPLKVQDIRRGWSRKSDDLESVCANCGQIYIPNIKIRIGGDDDFIEEECLFISPQALKALVSNVLECQQFELDVEQLRKYNSMIFWNLIWHFMSFELPYEFMMPYDCAPHKEVQTEWTLDIVELAMQAYKLKMMSK